MVYLSLTDLICTCLKKPKFETVIMVLNNDSIKTIFDFLTENLINVNDSDIVKKIYIRTSGKIEFSNGSKIIIVPFLATSLHIHCHLLVVDNRIINNSMERLEAISKAFEIRNYDKEKEREEKFNNETKGEQLMNIVQVNFINSITQKRYTYKVPNGISLNKGDIIRVRNKDGKEAIAVCVTNSENLSDNAVDMVMGGLDVLSNVIGVYNLVKFQEMTNK